MQAKVSSTVSPNKVAAVFSCSPRNIVAGAALTMQASLSVPAKAEGESLTSEESKSCFTGTPQDEVSVVYVVCGMRLGSFMGRSKLQIQELSPKKIYKNNVLQHEEGCNKNSDSIQDAAILFATIEVTHIAVIRRKILHRKDLRFGAGMDAAGGFDGFVVGEGEDQLVGEVMVAGHTLQVQLQRIFLRSKSASSNWLM